METAERTLNRIRGMCQVLPEEDGGCWVWTAYVDRFGTPKVRYGGHMRTVRRVVAFLLGLVALSGRGRVVIPTCDTHACVAPHHVRVTTVTAKVKKTHADGRFPADARIKSTRAKRAAAKLTMERVQEVRASPLPNQHFADLWGVDKTTISAARRGRTWRNLPGNPWQGLL